MYSQARQDGLRPAPTIGDHLDRLQRRLTQVLTIAHGRDLVLAEQFEKILETIEQIQGEAPFRLLSEETVRYFDDCQRIQTVLGVYCGEWRTLRECERLWLEHSDTSAASWLELPASDEDLLSCVRASLPQPTIPPSDQT